MMFTLIIQLLGFACVGHLLTDFVSSFDLPLLPDKPFRCDMCMSTWLSLIPFMLMYGASGILYAAISGVLSNYIYKYK